MTQAAKSPWVALFDLDGTITRRDTLLPFLWGFLKRRPRKMLNLWLIAPALLAYAGSGDRGKLKARMIRMIMGGESRARIDEWAEEYVNNLRADGELRAAALGVLQAHRDMGDHPVLLSASPDLYVQRIGRMLGFERTVCTEIGWNGDRLDGGLRTANRRGEEKSRCLVELRAQYSGMPVIAYGNALSDVDHMRRAERALLVNGTERARRAARQVNIPVSDWG